MRQTALELWKGRREASTPEANCGRVFWSSAFGATGALNSLTHFINHAALLNATAMAAMSATAPLLSITAPFA
jgi:hypothetical protein